MALVRFVAAASATPEQIAAFDANTLYFIGSGANGGQLYKGSTLFDAGSTAAAAELAQLKTYIGTLPVSAPYTDLIDYIDKTVAAAQAAGEQAASDLEAELATVAKSGAAGDVTVADTAGKLDATNVEAALAEIVGKIEDAGTAGAVTVTKTTGGASDAFAYKYEFYQGGNPITNGTIELGKDMVATSGELVNQDGQGNPGTFIKMTIANGTPFYIPVASLIEYNTFTDTAADGEIVVTDNNHSISMAIGKVNASKLVYKTAAETGTTEQTVAQAINALETASTTGVDNKITTAIQALDADVDATAGSVVTGITEVDGVITGVDEIALTAQNVAYGASNVKAALDTIGTIPAGATATTVVEYVDEKTGAGISALDADLDAAAVPVATPDAAHAVAVLSGVTQVDGRLTAVDTAYADAAGTAAAAEAAAKAYADTLLTGGTLA